MPTRVRVTLRLPDDLLEAVDAAVQAGGARSRSDFVASAARRALAAQRRAAIDAAFATMADDPEIRAEALQIEREFEQADLETWRMLPPCDEG